MSTMQWSRLAIRPIARPSAPPRLPLRPTHGFPLRPLFPPRAAGFHEGQCLRQQQQQQQQSQRRSRRTARSTIAGVQNLFHKHPIQMTFAVASILFGVSMLGYVNYWYWTYIVGAFHKYPEEVAKPLRRALFYTNQDLQPKEALRYYKQAVHKAEELQMDPMSDEVMGIKLQVAALMEKIEQWDKMIEVMERVRADNLEWLRLYGDRPHNRARRSHILNKTVQISTKLGDAYAHPDVWNRDMALDRMVWAVETALKERERRNSLGDKADDDGEWMSDSELGAAIESLAHRYESAGQHYLATPLFLQALRFYPEPDCHAVVLMNNVASCLAQQSPEAAAAVQAYAESTSIHVQPSGPRATRAVLVENGREWAQKALDVAAHITPPRRTDECDVGCAVALHNLGEFAEMRKEIAVARQKYLEAVSIARAIGFEDGVEQSSARLRALDGVSD